MMGAETHKTFCRFCHANCAMEVDVVDGKVVEVRGDPADPAYGGYTCMKGRELPDSHNSESRLHHSLVRNEAAGLWAVIESSANMTTNPRTESYVLTNDRGLYEFHRNWFQEMAHK
jgi:predicted molibdopterin-dependent oxidoreductase YjgC